MANDLQPFVRHGLRLKLIARQHPCMFGGRADLICEDRADNRLTVIELKRGLVTRDAVAQLLSYVASTDREWPRRPRTVGVLVGDRLDGEAAGIIGADRRLRFIELGALGFTRTT